jgi:ATPase family associated with various cellular activities (AAA)
MSEPSKPNVERDPKLNLEAQTMTHFSNFNDWIHLARQESSLVALQAAACDRPYVLQQFIQWAEELADLPVYFTNRDYAQWQRVTVQEEAIRFVPSEFQNTDLLDLIRRQQPGIFITEGLFQIQSEDELKLHVANVYFEQQQCHVSQHLILVDDEIHLPLSLYPILPVLTYPFPSKLEVQQQVAIACQSASLCISDQRQIVQACIGLPRGEIQLILKRAIQHSPEADACCSADTARVAQTILDYKQEKLRGRGINLLPQADVPVAAGLEGLDATLDKIRFLLQPEAEQRHLRPPKAVLLWGIPGSGKSLAAKLAAQRIGATLVACDWNSLIGATVRESMGNLNELIRYVSEIGTTILFFDEFEKAFSGWRSDTEGGVLGKLAGRLLSWMQDHTEPVIMFATINHLEMLPAEMIRRFDYIHFFGLPQAGALYQVFNVHLTQYFRYEFTELQWRILLREYRGCTPDEVGKAVQRVAHQCYFEDMARSQMSAELPLVTLDELLSERQQFTPAAAQKETSDQIVGILNRARYAKPAAGVDTSIFATAPQTLLGMDEAQPIELKPVASAVRSPRIIPPAIEEI